MAVTKRSVKRLDKEREMNVMKVLVTAVAFALGSMSAAMAADAMVSIDGLHAVGDGTLSEKHGKDISIANTVTASSNQTLEQGITSSPVTAIGGSMNNGPTNLDVSSFGGLGNFLQNTGNGNNLGEQMSLVL